MRSVTRSLPGLGLVVLALVTGALVVGEAQPQPASSSSSTGLEQLQWRYIGPVGNRVSAVTGVPGQPYVYYAGAASGGIWKTIDGGTNWEPIFDGQTAQSIGALAIAPSDPNLIWAGTGEGFIRSHISIGDGIYKSTDAGRTWTKMGLERTGRFARVVIDPRNPDIVLACAIGHAYGAQPERGVFRTADGGRTWDRVLFVDENTGCSDLAMDPNNPRILFAGMWQFEIKTWGRFSGGPSSGLYRSADGGLTWTRLRGNGLPTRDVGKIAVAIAQSNSNRVYALIETGEGIPINGRETDRGKLWRSDDGGRTWRLVSYNRNLGGRTHYYFRMAVAPDDENETYYLTAGYAVSHDGGENIAPGGFGSSPGGDNHDIWIDPGNADRMTVGNDGGISVSVNRGRTWTRFQLPIAQMYHVTVDNQIPYYVMGNRQDGPSFRGPSRTTGGGGGGGFGGGIPRSVWEGVAGGESGFAIPDPQDPNIVWSSASGSGAVGGIVTRYDVRNGQARNVEVWPDSTIGWPPADLKYRFVWTLPMHISPHDRNRIYVGSQHVHQTTDGGQSWQVISPDLTLNDKSRQQISGGLTPDNIGVEYGGVVMAIAESRLEKGLLWAGTNDGLVQMTRDGGKSWTNVTKNIPGLPEWGTVYNIEPSRFNAGTAYVQFDFHQVNGRDPYAYKTADYGKTWKLIVNGIPKSPMSYTHHIKEDPVRQGLLYLGTENAIYVSFDDGESWQPLQQNLPHAPVYWIAVQEHFNDLVIATYGRGFWILDDITPLQQLTAKVRDANAYLFVPRPAYRFQSTTVPTGANHDATVGQNPPYGASINYWLKTAPTGDVRIQILDAKGQVVRTLQGSKQAGVNRVYWDLRGEPSREIRLRTSPAYAPEVRVGPDGWRASPEGGRMSILMPPGTYTVKLSAGGQEMTQPLTVRKDPNSAGSETDIQTQVAMLMDIRQDLEKTADMVNLLEVIRAQIADVTALTAGDKDAAAIRQAADALEKKLLAVEDQLIQRKLTGQGQDGVRWPVQLVGKISYLGGNVATADFPPTSQAREVHQEFKKRIAKLQSELDDALSRDLGAFNKMLRDRGLGGIITRVPTS
jgi:photosystem II stability/assembly factor-like uncharacterized protein